MKSNQEVVALLREIRDLMQILLLHQTTAAPLVLEPPAERHVRSWSLSAHLSHARKSNPLKKAAGEPEQSGS